MIRRIIRVFAVMVLAVIVVAALPLVVIAAPFVLAAAATVFVLRITGSGGRGRRQERLNAEEVAVIQEFHYSLQQMEQRLETLETILIERPREKRDVTRYTA